jgi:hypothetical protein
MSLEFSSVNGSPCPSDAVLDDGKPVGRIYEPGIVSKRKGLCYVPGRSSHWLKAKNPAASTAQREAEED